MAIGDLTVLVPCHSLEDFPVHYRGQEADNLLSAWTAIWHPVLIAAAGRAPMWQRADCPPDRPGRAIVAIPEVAVRQLPPGYLTRAAAEGAVLLRGGTRESMLATALEAVVADGFSFAELSAELVADFLALGYCYLQVELLTRRMRYASNLDELQFRQQLVEAAQAAVGGDEATARQRLSHCYNLLSEERDHYYSVDVYLIDLTLTAPATLGATLSEELAQPQPTNVLLNGHVLEILAQEHPSSLQALRQAVLDHHCCLVGGSRLEGRWPLQDFESVAEEVRGGVETFRRVLETQPLIFGRWRGALTPLLPQVLLKAGYVAALHFSLDGSRVPHGSQAKTRWEGVDGTAIDALARPPCDASEPGVFLDLALKLGETMDMDHVATVCFAHWPRRVCRWYDELRRVALHTPALGKFYRLDAYFRDTMLPGRLDRFEATQYRYDYLKPAVIRQEKDLISRPMRYWRNVALRRAAEAYRCWATLLGSPPAGALPEVGSDEQPAPSEPLLQAYRQAEASLVQAMTRTNAPGCARRVVFNPLAASHRMCIEVADQSPPPPGGAMPRSTDPTKGNRRVVAEVPGWGFALIDTSPPSKSPAAARRRRLQPIASPEGLKTHDFEVRIHPETGGLLSVRSFRARPNLLSQQLAFRLTSPGGTSPGDAQSPYSQMVAQDVVVLDSDDVTGAIQSRGVLKDGQGETVAAFRQVVRATRGSPVVTLDIEIEPFREPRADPWNSYYACRFAWGDDTALISRSLHETRQRAEPGRWEAPHYVEIDTGHARVSVLTGGLPFHRFIDGRFLDCLLIVRGETQRQFRLAVAVDVPHPASLAQALLLEPPSADLAVSMPDSIRSGWLFHVGMRNLVATSWQPLLNQQVAVGFRVALLETAGTATHTHLSAFQPIAVARQLNIFDEPCGDLPVEDGKIRLDMTPYEWIRLEAHFAQGERSGP